MIGHGGAGKLAWKIGPMITYILISLAMSWWAWAWLTVQPGWHGWGIALTVLLIVVAMVELVIVITNVMDWIDEPVGHVLDMPVNTTVGNSTITMSVKGASVNAAVVCAVCRMRPIQWIDGSTRGLLCNECRQNGGVDPDDAW